MWIPSSPLLRRALLADAVCSGAGGALLVLDNDVCARLFSLPAAALNEVGLLSLGYAVLAAVLGSRSLLPKWLVGVVIAGNGVWALASFALLGLPGLQPSAWGQAFIVGQALVVALLAELQFVGLRRSSPVAALAV